LDHTTGVVTANVKFGKSELRALAGQMAATTHEGLDVGRDNFLTDSFLVGLSYRTHLGDHLRLDGAAYTVLDHRLVGRPFVLNTAVLGLSTSRKNYQAWLHILGQVGKWTGGGLAGRDEKISSYAAQVGMSRTLGRFGWSVNLFALSPDDDHHGNGVQSAFFGSGKNRSRSILMTEDETRDRYDNLDERMGSRWGALIYSPAGLAVADLGLGYQVTTVYTSSVIIAVGSTINPKRSLGARHVGVELAFLQDFQVSRNAAVFLNGLLFLPGTAAGAFVNDIDRSATQTMYGGTAGFRVKF